MRRAPSASIARAAAFAACVVVVEGCRIFGLSSVPCTSAGHCPPSDVCVDGICEPFEALADDGGALVDGGLDAGSSGAPETCRDVLALDPDAETGLHTISPPGRPDGVVVWCDMRYAGGGWLLLARSRNGATPGAWGYDTERGAPGDVDQPYSAGATSFGIVATELLVAEIEADGRPDRNVYRLVFDEDVLAARTKTVTRVDFEIIESDCDDEIDPTQDHPWMLQYAGCTERTDVYMLRDNPSCDNYGLRPDGFSLNYDNCHQAAGLQDRRGAIYAR